MSDLLALLPWKDIGTRAFGGFDAARYILFAAILWWLVVDVVPAIQTALRKGRNPRRPSFNGKRAAL